ncbi:pantoate--beta-alanine ligase [Mesorhizobium kowhaii]|uniref:pantoate--beta-alanine ligase n=1 Tax=Mesorhizobium kowhaii TaxID=1300272 RepID=UPI0035E795EB
MREADRLALSSRNVRLTPAERQAAPKLASVLFDAAEQLARGAPVGPKLVEARAAILAAGYAQVEYLELRVEEDLRPAARPRPACATAFCGVAWRDAADRQC